MLNKRPALGKGLSALIPDAPEPAAHGAVEVDIDLLAPNDYQPRVADGRRAPRRTGAVDRGNGVIQPIVVRQTGDGYRIIAGERRWRAAQRAGLSRVPVVVRDVPADARRAAARDGAHREHPARRPQPDRRGAAYRRLADEFQLTQEAIAAAVGKDRATVANTLRLLRLPDEMRNDCPPARLTMGHARAILALGVRGAAAARRARGEDARPQRPRDRGARVPTRARPADGAPVCCPASAGGRVRVLAPAVARFGGPDQGLEQVLHRTQA